VISNREGSGVIERERERERLLAIRACVLLYVYGEQKIRKEKEKKLSDGREEKSRFSLDGRYLIMRQTTETKSSTSIRCIHIPALYLYIFEENTSK
jgi:hypothetical protein